MTMKSRAKQARNDIGYFMWALGISGWVKAARDVTRDGARRTVKRDAKQGRQGGVM